MLGQLFTIDVSKVMFLTYELNVSCFCICIWPSGPQEYVLSNPFYGYVHVSMAARYFR